MSFPCRAAAQGCVRSLRAVPAARACAPAPALWSARRHNTTDASPKIAAIVDQISQLTLLETADLVASLKVRPVRFPSCRRCPSAARRPPSYLNLPRP
jgi:large subunit ribosomal protein L7/L12